MFCTHHLQVLGAKHVSTHDFWRHIDKGSDVFICDLLAGTAKSSASTANAVRLLKMAWL